MLAKRCWLAGEAVLTASGVVWQARKAFDTHTASGQALAGTGSLNIYSKQGKRCRQYGCAIWDNRQV